MCSFRDFRDGGESDELVDTTSTFAVFPTNIAIAPVSPSCAPGVSDYPETTSGLVIFVTNDYNGVVYFAGAILGGYNTIYVRPIGSIVSIDSRCDWLLCDSSFDGISVGSN